MDVKNKCANKEVTFSESLQKSVDNLIIKEGYKTYNIIKNQILTNGGSYLGLLYEVDVKGKTEDGDKETNLFIKNIIPNDTFNLMSVSEAYHREYYAYKELSAIFTALQDEANVPEKDRYKMAKCYDESNSETVILENLTRKGYKTYHRMEVMSLRFAELSVEMLARFHGLSYVLQNRRPEYCESKIKTMKQPFVFGEEFEASVQNMCQISSQPLDHIAKKKIDECYPTAHIFTQKYENHLMDSDSPGCCLTYGDYRVSNILVKEINGVAADIIPVDYQLIHYGSPLIDLIYFLFTASDQQFRKLHLNYLKDYYYQSLEKYLRYFAMDVDEVHPREEFEKEFKEKLDFGLMTGLFGSPFFFAEDDDVLDFSKDEMATATIRMNKKFDDRIKGIVDDFIHWGYL